MSESELVPFKPYKDETYLGSSTRFGGPGAVVEFDDCTSNLVASTFHGGGEGEHAVFSFVNCTWNNCSLTFLGVETMVIFENCTFNNTLLFGGPDLENPEDEGEGLLEDVLWGEEASFVFQDCKFNGCKSVDFEPDGVNPIPEAVRDFNTPTSNPNSAEVINTLKFSKCTFNLNSNSGNQDQGASEGSGDTLMVVEKS